MATNFMAKYPKLVKYKAGMSTYPGCVVFMTEAGSGTIVFIPFPLSEQNANLALMERVTLTNTEVEDFTGKVVFSGSVDPVLT